MEEEKEIKETTSQHTEVFMSDDIKDISKSLSLFQGEVKQPSLSRTVKVKTKTGGEYSFKYADLSECIKAASPQLKQHGLSVTQLVLVDKLVTILCHESGQWFKSVVPLPKATTIQDFGSAITYIKRYCFCAILGIVADNDDDGGSGRLSDSPEKTSQAEEKKAIERINAAETYPEYESIWSEYALSNPDICEQDSKFFKACVQKAKLLK